MKAVGCSLGGWLPTTRPPCNPPPNITPVAPKGGKGGRSSDGPPQFQCNLKKNFLRRLVFLCFLGQVTVPPWGGGGHCKGGGLQKGGGGVDASYYLLDCSW